ncbi:MAG: hydantoinase/oxoprolinase family protein, partial [bacterium]
PLPNMFMRLASTRGTNALLERKGVPVALFITRGFTDLLRIGTQQRPELFALEIRKPEPLYEAVVSVKERIAADGSILEPLALQELAAEIEKLLKRGIRVAGIAFMHSYRNPRHEQQLAKLLLDSGFQHVSCSAELAPFIKILPRAETAVVDAYLAPIMKDYLNRVLSSLSGGCLHVMTSAGGLVEARQFHAKDGLLSGPAGGVVGAAIAGRDSGFDKLIAFDMGGTSTDVARFDGEYEYVFEQQVGDAHLVAPALAIESVAAGGGSICSFDGYRLLVGPESASAQPGPACYGAGGPLTLTDVNLLLGRLDSNRFEIPISTQCAVSKLNELKKEISKHTGTVIQKETLLQGFLDIANERMADAIRRVSVRKGYAPQDYVLVAFGGAGGQHACGVARRLGIHKIIIPEDTSLLSAFGLGHAVLERFVEKQILQPLNKVDSKIPVWIDHLTEEAKKSVSHEGVPAKQIEVRRRIVHLRFVGQDSVLSVDYHPGIALQQAFETQYKEIFGHLPEGRQIEIESMRVVCSSMPAENCKQQVNFESYETNADGFTLTCFDNKWKKIAFYERSRLSPGAQLMGAALVFERHSTTVIEKGWKAEVDKAGALVLDCE